jgi:hypothetical protein
MMRIKYEYLNEENKNLVIKKIKCEYAESKTDHGKNKNISIK